MKNPRVGASVAERVKSSIILARRWEAAIYVLTRADPNESNQKPNHRTPLF
jgi:hypothetical protein